MRYCVFCIYKQVLINVTNLSQRLLFIVVMSLLYVVVFYYTFVAGIFADDNCDGYAAIAVRFILRRCMLLVLSAYTTYLCVPNYAFLSS